MPKDQTNRTIKSQADQNNDDLVFDSNPSPLNKAKPLVRMDLSQVKLP